MMKRRHLMLSALALAALSACSGPYTIAAEVSSFGAWPAGRAAGTYAFERLPSQAQAGNRQAALEDAARAALEKAGFRPAADARGADVLVTLGARVSAQDYAPWDDPLWWRWQGNVWLWRYGPYWRPMPGHAPYAPFDRRYDRDVALLLRDRATGEPLYEARASNDGVTQGDMELMGALFEAAMSDFPETRPSPHRVGVQRSR